MLLVACETPTVEANEDVLPTERLLAKLKLWQHED